MNTADMGRRSHLKVIRFISIVFMTMILAIAFTACGSGSSEADKAIDSNTEDTAKSETEGEAGSEAEPVGDSEGKAIEFQTIDIDGNPVNSAELFKEHRLTMVNIWGTYCGPCIVEMPDLEDLNKRLEAKDCAIVGIVIDVTDPEDPEMRRALDEVLDYTGVTYKNIIPWQRVFYDLPAEFIPSTYFIDSEGRIVGNMVVGARGADDYERLVDAALSSL